MWQRLRHASARVTQRFTAVPKATLYDFGPSAARAQVGKTFASVAKTTMDRLSAVASSALVGQWLVSVGQNTIYGLGSIAFWGGICANYSALLAIQSIFRDCDWKDLPVFVVKSGGVLIAALAQYMFEHTLLPLVHEAVSLFWYIGAPVKLFVYQHVDWEERLRNLGRAFVFDYMQKKTQEAEVRAEELTAQIAALTKELRQARGTIVEKIDEIVALKSKLAEKADNSQLLTEVHAFFRCACLVVVIRLCMKGAKHMGHKRIRALYRASRRSNARLTTDNKRLNDDNTTLRQSGEHLTKDNKRLNDDNTALRQSCEHLTKDNKRLNDDNITLRQSGEHLTKDNKNLNDDNTTLRQSCEHLAMVNFRLRQSNERLKDDNTSLRQSNDRLTMDNKRFYDDATTGTWRPWWMMQSNEPWKLRLSNEHLNQEISSLQERNAILCNDNELLKSSNYVLTAVAVLLVCVSLDRLVDFFDCCFAASREAVDYCCWAASRKANDCWAAVVARTVQLAVDIYRSLGWQRQEWFRLEELFRDLEQACIGKLDNLDRVDRKEAVLQACRNWASNQMLPESPGAVQAVQQAQPHHGSEWLLELVEREWVPGEVGSVAFGRLRYTIILEWREQRSAKQSPRPAGDRG